MKKLIVAISICCTVIGLAVAQETESSGDIGEKLSNPIASMISVPFQTNSEFGIGDNKGCKFTMNIQPVIPFQLGEKLNLITRVIVPVVNQYNITKIGESETGISDVFMTAFFSPISSGKVTWGVGPNILLPTGTNDVLSAKKWGVGPSAVVLTQTNGFTLGALLNQTWSIGGDAKRADISQTFFQPFMVYNWASGMGVTFVQFEMSKEWNSGRFVGSYNPMLSMVSAIGKQPISMAIGPRLQFGNDNPTDWGIRASIILVFPK